jgi:uncharacterized protein (TIGR03437 family)
VGFAILRAVRGTILGILLAILPASLTAQTPVSWKPLDEILTNFSRAAEADLRMVVLHRDKEVYRFKIDFRGTPEVLPIASASKWLAGATILRLVDAGYIGLDDPVSMYLPYFRDEKAGITIRQLLTHTSGLSGDYPCMSHRDIPMDDCVQQIAARPMLLNPGTDFSYGDVSLQVIARVAEVVTGLRWNEIFRSRIAEPMGLENTSYENGSEVQNPSVAGGAVSTIDEYLLFLRMIRNGGVSAGTRILSRRAVDLMLADQTAGAIIRSTPYSAYEIWLEGMEDGLPNGNSSQGGYGVSPYYDRERDLIFLLFVYDQRRVYPSYYYQIQSFLNSAFAPTPDATPSALQLRSLNTTTGLRTWYEYIPKACQSEDAYCPLLVALHPNGTNGRAFGTSTRLREKAEREGFIVALPNGMPADDTQSVTEPSPEDAFDWEIRIPGARSNVRDDADYILSLTAALEHAHPVDPERIYLAGHREGADLAQRVLCRNAERFAAFGSIHATLPYPSAGLRGDSAPICQPREPVAAFFYTATVPPSQEASDDAEPPLTSFDFWKQRNGCAATNDWQPFAPTEFTYSDASGCWPGTTVRNIRSTSSDTTWPATGWQHAWDFLRGRYRTSVKEGRFVSTSAASYLRRESASSGLLSAFGLNIAPRTTVASQQPLPKELDGLRAELKDSHGTVRDLGFSLVSPFQVNFVLPENLAPGAATVTIYRDTESTHKDWLYIRRVAPALFSAQASGEGAPAGEVLYVHADGSRESQFLWQAAGRLGIVPRIVELSRPDTEVYLVLYGTGWRNAGEGTPVEAYIGDHPLEVLYAGPQPQYEGLDQVNLRIPALDLPSGEYPLYVRVGTRDSNRLRVSLHTNNAQ